MHGPTDMYRNLRAGVESATYKEFGLRQPNSGTGEAMALPQNSATQEPRPDPNEKLVKVFESEEETEALVVKGLLESAGIESDVAPLSLTQYAFPNIGGTLILVREEDAQEARRLIADYQQGNFDGDEEAEEAASEEPPVTG